MSSFPHETVDVSSKKRFVWRLCDLFWFTHRRKPTRRDIRAAYGPTDSSLDSVDSYLSGWWTHMKREGLA